MKAFLPLLLLSSMFGCRSASQPCGHPVESFPSRQGFATYEEGIDTGDGLPRIRRGSREWYSGPEFVSPAGPPTQAPLLLPPVAAPHSKRAVEDQEVPQLGLPRVYNADGTPARSFIGDGELELNERPNDLPPLPRIVLPPKLPKPGEPGFERTT